MQFNGRNCVSTDDSGEKNRASKYKNKIMRSYCLHIKAISALPPADHVFHYFHINNILANKLLLRRECGRDSGVLVAKYQTVADILTNQISDLKLVRKRSAEMRQFYNVFMPTLRINKG